MDFIRSVVGFVVVLGVLVFIHEMGHYLAARWRGVHVEAFSIGFGRSFARWTDRRGTVWKLAWLPLGGYVKLHGQERPEEVSDDVRARWIPGRTFHEKSVLSRAIVVGAGPLANFVLAVVLYSALFMTAGRSDPIGTVVSEVTPGGGAAAAGLMAGDRIDSIDGTPVRLVEDLVEIVSAAPGRTLRLRVERAGAALDVAATPNRVEQNNRQIGLLGLKFEGNPAVRLDPLTAVGAAFTQTADIAGQILSRLGGLLTGHRNAADLGGVLTIATLSGQSMSLGFAALVGFIAFLSVNLGLINLLPIPVLDGGHLVFFGAEALRGKPLPPRVQEYGFRAGFALIACLMLFANWNDLGRIGVVRWFTGLIG